MKYLPLCSAVALILFSLPVFADHEEIVNTQSSPIASTFNANWSSQNTNDVWKYVFQSPPGTLSQTVEISITSMSGVCGNSVMSNPPCAGFKLTCNSATTDYKAGTGGFCTIIVSEANPVTISIVNDGNPSGGIAAGGMQFKVK